MFIGKLFLNVFPIGNILRYQHSVLYITVIIFYRNNVHVIYIIG